MSKQSQVSQSRKVALALTTALAGASLAGCTAKAAPEANYSAAKASAAIEAGKAEKAVEHAEAAVLAAPRDAAGRTLLGLAYLEAGRFASAATTLGEAIELGDTSQRTLISYALAQTAAGRSGMALSFLDKWESALDPADFGLAVALAGRPTQGVHVLGNALRSGQNSAKVRQNLAYAFALTGDWRSARLMVSQDVPANKVGDRLGEWAGLVAPEMYQRRIAQLLGVPIAQDPGQPAQLALANHPSIDMLASEAATQVAAARSLDDDAPAFALAGELPPVGNSAGDSSAVLDAGDAALADAGLASTQPAKPEVAVKFVSREVVQKLASHTPRTASSAPRVSTRGNIAKSAEPTPGKASPAFTRQDGDYRVQLGSYYSMSDAQAAWKVFLKRHPELDGAQPVISKAKVKGKIYYRVAAGGYAKTSARALCSAVKSKGGGCIAYSASRPLAGTIDNNVRLASR